MRAFSCFAVAFLAASSTAGAAPANDNFASRQTIFTGSGATGSNVAATLEAGEFVQSVDGESISGASVWWKWTPATTGWYAIDTDGSNFDTVLYVFTGSTLSTLEPRAVNDEYDDESGDGGTSRVVLFATSGIEHQIAVHGYDLGGFDTGTIALQVTNASPPPARLSALSFAPGAANIADDDVLVSVTVSVVSETDFEQGSLALYLGPDTTFWADFDASNRTAGNARDGTYQFPITLTSDAPAGHYEISLQLETSGSDPDFPDLFLVGPGGGFAALGTIALPPGTPAFFDVVKNESPLDPYAQWATGFFAPGSSDAARLEDPDADGLANVVEYAFGLDPTIAEKKITVDSANPGNNPPGGRVPAVDFVGTGANRRLRISFLRRLGEAGIGYVPQAGTGLTSGPANGLNWTDLDRANFMLTPIGGGFELVQASDQLPTAEPAATLARRSRFLRVLVSPEAPYFTGQTDYGSPAFGPVSIALPDGGVISNGTDQLMVFLDPAATSSQLHVVTATLPGANARVVGEIPSIRLLQIRMQDTAQASGLITALEAVPGVLYAGPNPIAQFDQECSRAITGTAWRAADNLFTDVSSANDVVVGVLDHFDARCVDAGLGSPESHGAVTEAFLKVAAGGALASSIHRIDLSANGCRERTQFGDIAGEKAAAFEAMVAAVDFIKKHPGKKIVINASIGANNDPNAANHEVWYATLAAFTKSLQRAFGDRVIIVKSGGNAPGVSIPDQEKFKACNLVTVGALDNSTPTATSLAYFSSKGPGIKVYVPACGINPDGVFDGGRLFGGTSNAAPQVAGQLAAIWVKHPSLSACQLAGQVANLNVVTGYRRFDGIELAQLAGAQVGVGLNGTYAGSFSGSTTETALCNWRHTVSGNGTATIVGSGTAAAPYTATFTFRGTDVITVLPGSDPVCQGGTVTLPLTSGGPVPVGTDGGVQVTVVVNEGTAAYRGTVSEGQITGTLTISYPGFDSPIVGPLTLTKQ